MNKNFVLFVFLTLCACFLGASAQRSHLPILEEGKVWRHKHFFYGTDELTFYTQTKIVGDTIINDTTAVKIGMFNEPIEDSDRPWRLYYAYEDNGRVYVYSDEFKHFVLQLDFNYSTGEKIARNYGNFYQIYSDVQVELFGVSRRVLNLGSPFSCWIEGIGSYDPKQVIYPIWSYEVAVAAGVHLVDCFKTGERVYSEDWLKEYSGVKEVGVDTAAQPVAQQIYDVYGRRVSNPLPGSIYIVDGRKVVWK